MGRTFLAALAVSLTFVSCYITEQVEFNITYQSTSGVEIDCETAGLSTVRIEFLSGIFDGQLLERADFECSPDPFEMEVDPGSYVISIRGIDSASRICFEDSHSYVVLAEEQGTVNWLVAAVPGGATAGCQYP